MKDNYDYGLSSFEELLERDNSVSVHNRSIQCLTTELYRTFNDMCPDIMKDAFPLNTSSSYNISSRHTFTTRYDKKCTV